MFKNLHLKFSAFFLATLFWIFVVSIENSFFKLPEKIPVRVFNLSSELALASPLEDVSLTIAAGDGATAAGISEKDFEAFVDVRNIGAGSHKIAINVNSKNPRARALRVEPSEVEVQLEPVKQKLIRLTPELIGAPEQGFRIHSTTLKKETITVSGAQSLLAKIARAVAEIKLDGNERQEAVKIATVRFYDRESKLLEGIESLEQTVEAVVVIEPADITKQVGVKVKITGAAVNGTVKTIETDPGVVSVVGSDAALNSLTFIETETIDLKDFPDGGSKKVFLVLPAGVALAPGEKNFVTVRIEIEKNP